MEYLKVKMIQTKRVNRRKYEPNMVECHNPGNHTRRFMTVMVIHQQMVNAPQMKI